MIPFVSWKNLEAHARIIGDLAPIGNRKMGR
jgi:hypothetical protein